MTAPGVRAASPLVCKGIISRYLGGWWPLGQSLTHKCSGGRFALVCCAGITKTPRRESTPFLDCRVGDGHGGDEEVGGLWFVVCVVVYVE